MDTTAKNPHALRGEWMLALAVCINSFGVVLMLYSGAGISAISSVPFAFSQVFPRLTLGTWTSSSSLNTKPTTKLNRYGGTNRLRITIRLSISRP